MKDTLDIQSIGGTGFVVGAPLQVTGQFASPRIVDATRLSVTNRVLSTNQDHRNLRTVSQVRHLLVVVVNRVEAGLVLQTEYKDHSVDPGGELRGEEEGERFRINWMNQTEELAD